MIEQDRPGKIFVGGLSSNIDRDTIDNAFAKYGRITEILIIRDKITNLSRGYGFITYENPLDAEDAVKGMDGQTINGKEIHVEQAVRAVHDDRGGSMRSSRGGMRTRGGGPSGRSRGSRGGGFSSRRGGMSRDGPSMSGRDGPRRDSMRRGSPPPRRGSMGMRSRGRGGAPRKQISQRKISSISGRNNSYGRREMTPPRKSFMSSSPRHGGYSDGPSNSRRGQSPPPRRMTSDYMDRREDRFSGSGFSDRLAPRSRDPYGSPPRDSGRGMMDSRMSSGRPSRDYQSSRDFAPSRDYNTRNFSPERDPIRSRAPPQRDSYSLGGRDDRRDSFSRSGGGRDYMSPRGSGGGDYMGSRDGGRDYSSSRDYGSSNRDFQSNRDYGSRFDSHDMGGGGGGGSRYTSRDMDSRPTQSRGPAPRSYDGYDDSPPSRSYGGAGVRGPSARSGPSFNTRGGGSSDRRESRGGGGLAGGRRPGPPPSRGPPPPKRSRMDGPPSKRGGPPPFRR